MINKKSQFQFAVEKGSKLRLCLEISQSLLPKKQTSQRLLNRCLLYHLFNHVLASVFKKDLYMEQKNQLIINSHNLNTIVELLEILIRKINHLEVLLNDNFNSK